MSVPPSNDSQRTEKGFISFSESEIEIQITNEKKAPTRKVTDIYENSFLGHSLPTIEKKSLPNFRQTRSVDTLKSFFSSLFAVKVQPTKSVQKLEPLESEIRSVFKSLFYCFNELYPKFSDISKPFKRFLSETLLHSIKELPNAKNPLKEKKSTLGKPIFAEKVVHQCFTWLWYQLLKTKSVDPHSDLSGTAKKIISEFSITELNSLIFILSFHQIHGQRVRYPTKNEKTQNVITVLNNPIHAIQDQIGNFIAKELETRAKKNSWISTILEKGIDLKEELFKNTAFRSSIITFLQDEVHDKFVGDFFYLMHEYKALFTDSVESVTIDINSLKIDESKINLQRIQIPSNPQIESEKLKLAKEIKQVSAQLNTTKDIVNAIDVTSYGRKKNIPEKIFDELEQDQLFLFNINHIQPSANVSFWKSRSFYYFCLASNLPLFEISLEPYTKKETQLDIKTENIQVELTEEVFLI